MAAGDSPRHYWDRRALSFAGRGAGLAAVCSYGMPWFYNRYIDLLQRRALLPWIAVEPGARVLEIGCGVGRWSREMARAGADVVGLDLSAEMLREARRRTQDEGLDRHCRFIVADTAEFELKTRFSTILGVTVLQHVLDPDRFQSSIDRLAGHLAPGGRIVLLEVAPARSSGRCDSPVFLARREQAYLDAFARAGLRRVAVRGVDPAPFRMWFLPWYRAIPRPIAAAGMIAAVVAGVPLDLLAASCPSDMSWHKVFVLTDSRDARVETPGR
jgi:2-polyprenyl-3-methyl-5-hydroxy-6-metoxy-1,4-benzoquinol methylase